MALTSAPESVVKQLVEALRFAFQPKEPIRHDYKKGVWFETSPPTTSVKIDAHRLVGTHNSFPIGELPKNIAEFEFERLGVTEYRVTKVSGA